MKTKFTPGPWTVNEHTRKSVHAEDRLVALTNVRGYQKDAVEETMQANARLISACPDMLDALKSVVHVLRDWDADTYLKCKDAIAKATGEL